MDAEGKETMISAVDKLLYIQRNFSCLQETPKRRFKDITIYMVSGFITFCVVWVFWEFFINPCLLEIGITPLTMVRIIVTALLGSFCLGSGLVGFLQRWLKAPLFFLLVIAGIACIDPQILTDFIGFFFIALIAAALVVQKKRQRVIFAK
jgi:TRAP-type uncharacterized transport system fused permease subunit